jgi:hypothetical protein
MTTKRFVMCLTAAVRVCQSPDECEMQLQIGCHYYL